MSYNITYYRIAHIINIKKKKISMVHGGANLH